MAADLTKEASEGFDWQKSQGGLRPTNAAAAHFCPYLNSSPAAMAWHLGRHLATAGYQRPTTARGGWRVYASRGDTFRLALSQAAIRFQWNADNTFIQIGASDE